LGPSEKPNEKNEIPPIPRKRTNDPCVGWRAVRTAVPGGGGATFPWTPPATAALPLPRGRWRCCRARRASWPARALRAGGTRGSQRLQEDQRRRVRRSQGGGGFISGECPDQAGPARAVVPKDDLRRARDRRRAHESASSVHWPAPGSALAGEGKGDGEERQPRRAREEHHGDEAGGWRRWICRGKGKGGREADLKRLREVGIPVGFAGTLHILG
jgi:hypothetical protein